MMKKLLPIIFLFIGMGAGVGAGIALRPPASPAKEATDKIQAEHTDSYESAEKKSPEAAEYVKLNNQFVVPIVKDGRVHSLVVMALSVEVPEGQKDAVYQREPKLRDSFLQVLFDHANMGGFDGAFTEANNLAILRNALKEMGRKVLGRELVSDILITEIARQDY